MLKEMINRKINIRGGFGLLFFAAYRGGTRLRGVSDKLCP